MTLEEAMADQAAWLNIWLPILMFGSMILPVVLLIWKPSRLAGLAGIAAGLLSFAAISWMYEQLGYVKLLGLPHVLFYTPVVIYFISRLRSGLLPKYAVWIMSASLVIILISLAFDYTDVARYFLGERTPLAVPAGFEG
ncbi:hypothetical protein [Octadecabacter ascidiaceicola]|uniref:Uncharacterized protein n=1 Tax=Octadecabacter ascidiaceicola TaxID=1655543 RepID=A0A238KNH6_9RHOB|nr:hypothetical protein [Octadecabacter ascidiaceicola]SMX44394.1 hypothetical protein OCA8868_03137 [Octadecabacter ascidiaceicola]